MSAIYIYERVSVRSCASVYVSMYVKFCVYLSAYVYVWIHRCVVLVCVITYAYHIHSRPDEWP